MEIAYRQLEPIKHFLSDPAILKSGQDPTLDSLYKVFFSGIKFSSEQKIYNHFVKLRTQTASFSAFVTKIFDILGQLVKHRQDPMLTSIVKSV